MTFRSSTAEYKDDLPLSKLRRIENRPQSIRRDYTFVTDNHTGTKKIAMDRTSHCERRNEGPKSKYGAKEVEIRWQEYHKNCFQILSIIEVLELEIAQIKCTCH